MQRCRGCKFRVRVRVRVMVLTLTLNMQVTDFVQSPGFAATAGRPRASILCGTWNAEFRIRIICGISDAEKNLLNSV